MSGARAGTARAPGPCGGQLLPGAAGGFPDTTKAVDVVAKANVGVTGALVVAIASAAVLGAESPGATTQHFVLTFLRSPGIFPRSLLVIIHLVEIVAPLPNVARHVVESPR